MAHVRRSGMLRAGLEISRDVEAVVITDRALGFEARFEGPAAEIIESLAGPRHALLEKVRAVLPDEDPSESLAAFLQELSELGLLAEGGPASLAAVHARHASDRPLERARALRDAVTFARARTRFHRERLGPGVLDDAAAWAAAPIMTRDELRRGFPDAVVVEGLDLAAEIEAGRVAISTTSGTTDERVQVASIAGVGAADAVMRRLMGLDDSTPMARGAAFTTPICSTAACHLGDSTLEERTQGVTTFLTSSNDLMAMTRDEVARVIDELGTVAPDVFFVHPWYAVFVGLRARALGLALPQVPVILMTYQFPMARHRRLLHELYGGTPRSFYSATEAGGYIIASECRAGNLHIREDHVHVDFEPTGVRDRDGELARVLVTSLKNEVMPLVRYRVGDLARPGPTCSCPWGPEWPTLVFDGRARDVMFTKDGRAVTTREIDAALGDDLFDFYSITQVGPAAFRAQLICDGPHEATFVDRLKHVLGADVDIQARRVERITPERSLKFRQTRVDCALPWPSPFV